MQVKYKRDYELIIGELSDALRHLDGFYRLLEIDHEDWDKLGEEGQTECLKTMSHDIIYGLGAEPVIQVGKGQVQYEPKAGQIKIFDGDNTVHVVRLN